MNKIGTKIVTILAAFAFASCQTPNNISFNENTAQLMLGHNTAITLDVFRTKPIKITGTKKSASGIWYYKREYNKVHYVPPSSYTSSSYNYYTDTEYITTTYRPGYTYTTPDFDAYIVEVFSSNHKITGVDFTARQINFASNSWSNKNCTLYAWNRYNANDQIEELKELEKNNPSLTTPDMRLKGCMQAAKYDSIDLLEYYLVECKVPLDIQIETWERGSGDLHSLSESGCFVLGKASVREIITARNNKKVIRRLTKLGVL